MKFSALTKLIPSAFITALMIVCLYSSACNNGEKPGLRIYLADTGELILSEEHIGAYYWDSHTIELNNKGIEKWNSYIIYDDDIPRLKNTLYQNDFVLSIEGEEAYRGKFTSVVSSVLPQGVVISDASIILEELSNTIKIGYHHPSSSDAIEDPRYKQEIFEYLDSQGLIK